MKTMMIVTDKTFIGESVIDSVSGITLKDIPKGLFNILHGLLVFLVQRGVNDVYYSGRQIILRKSSGNHTYRILDKEKNEELRKALDLLLWYLERKDSQFTDCGFCKDCRMKRTPGINRFCELPSCPSHAKWMLVNPDYKGSVSQKNEESLILIGPDGKLEGTERDMVLLRSENSEP